MSYFLLLLLWTSAAFSDSDFLKKIQIKNLDLTYEHPHGQGTLEKFSIGVSTLTQQKEVYPLEVYWRENSFDLLSQYIDFQWLNPISFIHKLSKVKTQKANLKIDSSEHHLKGEVLEFTPENSGPVVLNQFNFDCRGASQKYEMIDRLMKDCLEKMEGKVSYLELPFEFLDNIFSRLPDGPTEPESDLPAQDFFLSIKKGDFFSYLRIKYIVRAYLRFWGHAQFENEGKTFAVRVDLIKFGIFPVTDLVMNELRRQINHPQVQIDPPWIRINRP